MERLGNGAPSPLGSLAAGGRVDDALVARRNADAKLLLPTHAFEVLGCPAVEFRTHWMNLPSRAAIERLGAKLDGVLRAHRRTADGSLRDTCVYSIIASERPQVRAGLEHRLARHVESAG